jgi:hypothetical protein
MEEIDVIKKPYTKSGYTEETLMDLAICVDDPIYFIKKFVKIQHPLKGAVDFEPFPYQLDLINAFHYNRFVIGLTGRQLGKSLQRDSSIYCNGCQIKIGNLFKSLNIRTKLVEFLESALVKMNRNK